MLPSIAASRSGHWNHDGSRKWQCPTRSPLDPDPDQHIAAKTFGKTQSFAAGLGELRGDRPRWQALDKLIDQRQTLLDLADADPDAGIDVAFC